MKKFVLIAMVSLLSVAAHARVTATKDILLKKDMIGHMKAPASVGKSWILVHRGSQEKFLTEKLYNDRVMKIRSNKNFKATDLEMLGYQGL